MKFLFGTCLSEKKKGKEKEHGVKNSERWIDPDNIKELISELIPELSGSGRLAVSHK